MTENDRWDSLIRTTTDDVKRLTAVWRYSSIPVAVRENVAEHSYWVSLYGVLIARALGASSEVQGWIAIYGLTHDLPECVTGDVVRPFKYSSDEFKLAVDKAEESMASVLPEALSQLMAVQEDLKPEYVAAIVKAADFLSLYQYMRREAARGNLEIIPFFMRMVVDLEGMVKRNEGAKIPVPGGEYFRPDGFYHALWSESILVANDCFGDLARPGSRWMREV